MAPYKIPTVAARILNYVRKEDFRFAGEVDGHHHLIEREYEIYDQKVVVEFLFRFSTLVKNSFSGSYYNPAEYEVTTTITHFDEAHVYHAGACEALEREIEKGLADAVEDALNAHGRTLKTIV